MKIIVRDIDAYPTKKQIVIEDGRYKVPDNLRVTSVSVYETLNECVIHTVKERK